MLVKFKKSRTAFGGDIWVNPDKVYTVERSQHPKTAEPDVDIRMDVGGFDGAHVFVEGGPAQVARKLGWEEL